jgi:hypothetical protein
MRYLSITIAFALAAATGGPASARSRADWKVQAGKSFQKVGEYTVRATPGRATTRFADAIHAWGEPSSCHVEGSDNHATAAWASRGIWTDLWTYGGLPAGENGCMMLL